MLFIGCPIYPSYEINYEKGHVPEQATNFTDVNTEWDDMNSAGPPSIDDAFKLFLSSDRARGGADFNIHWFNVSVHFDQTNGNFMLAANGGQRCRESLNSDSDEYGPYLLNAQKGSLVYVRYESGNGWYEEPASLFLLSSTRTPNSDLDIYVSDLTCESKLSWDTSGSDITMTAVSAINSLYDDAYPTIGPDNRIYFCSNRNGDFEIFALSLSVDPFEDLNALMTDLKDPSKNATIETMSILNSVNDDKCPYIVGNTMLFVSNRSGSLGGFDIWKSLYFDGKWSEPVNLGSVVNSSSNEYRPIFVNIKEFTNCLMLFSSDRVGGKGGYDIYYAGFTKE
jgi:hypothetical protein